LFERGTFDVVPQQKSFVNEALVADFPLSGADLMSNGDIPVPASMNSSWLSMADK